MDRRNQILTLLLIVQLALVGYLFRPSAGSSGPAGKLLGDLKTADVTAVNVKEKDKNVKMSKSGDNWVLPDNGAFPVEAVKVTDLISKLLSIDTSRLVASNASSYNRLKVADDDYVKNIELTTSDGKTHTVLVGTSPSARATNVRVGGSDAVYTTGKISAYDISTDLSGWINTTYVQVPEAQATHLNIQNASGKLSFTRVNTTTWTLDGLTGSEVFNQNNFSTVLTRLGTMQMIGPVGKEAKPEYGLDKPSAVISVTYQAPNEAAKGLTLTVGAKDADGKNYYAKSSASDFFVKIATFTLDQFVTDTRDRYLQPPPTPAASSSITATTPLTSFVTAPVSATAPISASKVTTTTKP
jgi:hypothetical protein